MPDPVLPDASFCHAPAFSRCPGTHLPGTDTRPEAQHGDSARYRPLGPGREDRPRPPPEAPPPGGTGPSLLPVGGTRAGAPGSPSVLSPLPNTRSSAQPVGPPSQQPGWEPEAETGCWVHPGSYTQVGRGPLTACPSLMWGRGRGQPMPCGRRGSRGPSSLPGASASGRGGQVARLQPKACSSGLDRRPP